MSLTVISKCLVNLIYSNSTYLAQLCFSFGHICVMHKIGIQFLIASAFEQGDVAFE